MQAAFAAAVQNHQAGRLAEAERLYRQILAVNPRHADSLHLLGVMALQTKRHDLAVRLIGQAIGIDARVPSYHNNLGTVLKEQGWLEEAVASYRRAVSLKPDYPGAHNNLGNALRDLGRLDEAIASYRKALNLKPNVPEVYNSLGTALRDQGRPEEAIARHRRALDLKPDYPEAYNDLGNALKDQGRLDEAVICYRKAIELNPDYPDARSNLSLLLLAQGDMAAGWKEYEWRWKTPQLAKAGRGFTQPQWCGEEAAGRTLLIHAEQGFGDTLQFCRYAPLAAARGLRVILEVQKPLVRLLRGLPGADLVLGQGETLPDFDLHCPMLSMPLALETTLETIPGAVSYLQADPAAVAAWATRLAAMPNQGPRIGLVWSGNPRIHAPVLAVIDRRRSIAPDRLAPLFEVPGLRFFSLQKDGPRAPASFPLTDLMEEMADFADTAALIANLDLVVSVDTAVVHLAAALGRPVWMLDRFDPCWRWLVGRRDSPWYPTLRLYRQPHPGDWDPVIAEVVRDLRRFAETRVIAERVGSDFGESVARSPVGDMALDDVSQTSR